MTDIESLTPFDRYVIFASAMRNISKIINRVIEETDEEESKTSDADMLLLYQFQRKILETILQFMLDMLIPDFFEDENEEWEEGYDEDYT